MTSQEFKESADKPYGRDDIKAYLSQPIDQVAENLGCDRPEDKILLRQVQDAVRTLDVAEGQTDAATGWALKKTAVVSLRDVARKFETSHQVTAAAMISQLADVYYNRNGKPVQACGAPVPPKFL